MLKKKIIALAVLASIVLFAADFVFAQRPLEIDYPKAEDIKPETTAIGLPEYIKYIFNFGIGIAGLIAFGCLVYGGFRYLTSAGNPSAMGDANSQIWAGLIGLMVILGSWLLLTTINPQLIIINPQLGSAGLATTTTGVFLCKTESSQESCLYAASSVPKLDSNYEDKITSIQFINSPDSKYEYMAVLHEARNYGWTCNVFTSNQTIPQRGSDKVFPGDGISSVTVFQRRLENSDCTGVTLYDGIEQRGNSLNVVVPGQDSLGGFGEKARSIKINGRCMVLLFRDANYNNVCEVITISNDPDLKNNSVFDDKFFGCLWCKDDSVSSIKIIPL